MRSCSQQRWGSVRLTSTVLCPPWRNRNYRVVRQSWFRSPRGSVGSALPPWFLFPLAAEAVSSSTCRAEVSAHAKRSTSRGARISVISMARSPAWLLVAIMFLLILFRARPAGGSRRDGRQTLNNLQPKQFRDADLGPFGRHVHYVSRFHNDRSPVIGVFWFTIPKQLVSLDIHHAIKGDAAARVQF